jgi:putative ABC transport system permease protein
VQGDWFKEGADECVVGAALSKKWDLKIGDTINIHAGNATDWRALRVTGILSTGGSEDDAIVAPIGIGQQVAGKPGEYRRLYVSALTKPEDAFARKDPKSMTAAEYDKGY